MLAKAKSRKVLVKIKWRKVMAKIIRIGADQKVEKSKIKLLR